MYLCHKMASSAALLNDIDETFCQCSVCLQQYKEPKQLPCLHRYCNDCLQKIIESERGSTVGKCPTCRSEFTIPREGVVGFKTDFYMKCIIEYIELHKSLQEEQIRECYDCLKTLRVTAYCFKCTNFLCKRCHDNHVTNNTLKDHRQHVLSLRGKAAENLTLQKLVSLHEAQRCQIHPENLARLCCLTCENVPICVTCTYGTHQNHDVKDVNMQATNEREKLNNDLKMLSKHKKKLHQIIQKTERIGQDLTSNAKEEKENFKLEHDRKIETITREKKKRKENVSNHRSEIESKRKRDLMMAKEQMEQAMEEIKKNYDEVCDDINGEANTRLNDLEQESDRENEVNQTQLRRLEIELKTLMAVTEKQAEERSAKIQEIRNQVEVTKRRFENLSATGRSVIKTANDWIAVRCIPDIRGAVEPLNVEMKRTFPELETLSHIQVRAEVTFDDEPFLEIGHIKLNMWHIDGITSNGDSTIVITGGVPKKYKSHLTVCKVKGKVLRKETFQSSACSSDRYCAFLSQFKVATVCWHNDIILYDIRGGSSIHKKISHVISSWPSDRLVSCVAVDSSRRHILVGQYNSTFLYVFDDQLNYHHTLSLPKTTAYPIDLFVNESSLVLCDKFTKKAYLINMEKMECKLIHEFAKPVVDGRDWLPISVSGSKKGFFFILWATGTDYTCGKRSLVQYSQYGCDLLTTVEVVNNARCVTVVATNQTEKLLVATFDSGKFFSYSIKYM